MFLESEISCRFQDSHDGGTDNRAFCSCEHRLYADLIPCPSTQSHSYKTLTFGSDAHHDLRPQSSSSTIARTTATSQRSDNGTTSSDAAAQLNRTLSQGTSTHGHHPCDCGRHSEVQYTNHDVRGAPASSPTFSGRMVFENGVEPGSGWSSSHQSSTPVANGVPQLPVSNCVHCQRPHYINYPYGHVTGNEQDSHVTESEIDASLSRQGRSFFQNLGCNPRRDSDETTNSAGMDSNLQQTIPKQLAYSRISSPLDQLRYPNYMLQPPLGYEVNPDHLSRVESQQLQPQSPRKCQMHQQRPSGPPENQRNPSNSSIPEGIMEHLSKFVSQLNLGHLTESVVPCSGHPTESKQSGEPRLLQGSMEMKELSVELPLTGASASSESVANPPTVPKAQDHCANTCGNAVGDAGLPAHSQSHRQGNQTSEMPAHETQFLNHNITGSLAQEQDTGNVLASAIQPRSPGPTTEQPCLQVCQRTGSPEDQTRSPRGRTASPTDEEIDAIPSSNALPEMRQSASAVVQNQLLETTQPTLRSRESQRQLPATSQSELRSEDEANDPAQQAAPVPRLAFSDDPDNYPATPDHQYENPNPHVSIASTECSRVEYSQDPRFHNSDAVQDDTSHA